MLRLLNRRLRCSSRVSKATAISPAAPTSTARRTSPEDHQTHRTPACPRPQRSDTRILESPILKSTNLLGDATLPKVNAENLASKNFGCSIQLGPLKFPSSLERRPDPVCRRAKAKTGCHSLFLFSLRCPGLSPERAEPYTCSRDLSFTWWDSAGSHSVKSCRR